MATSVAAADEIVSEIVMATGSSFGGILWLLPGTI